MRLKLDLADKLVHSELLDDLKNVNLLCKLALSILKHEVVFLLACPTAAAIELVEPPKIPESFVLVREGLA